MSRPARHLELRCPGCLWREQYGPIEIAARLRRVGKLRPGRESELPILYELFRAAAEEWTCPQCGRRGLTVGSADEPGDWPDVVLCAACSKPISKERLEAIPGVRYCAGCQQGAESGRPKEDREYCPRCGAPMEIRISQVGGRTRYILACGGNPPCPL